jgi:uncharacterized membrane protein (UPF0182 family)
VNLLISGQIDANSTIMIRRSIIDRATRAVPFLGFDSDPYLAVVDGQPTWIWDAYTTTTEYPYSQAIDLGQATGGGPQTVPSGVTVNYLRNSVKVTVDAYDGTVTYYADLDEPIVQAWDNAFPDLFENIDTAPASLREHFRYPENLFQVQATQFARYHVQDPTRFFNRQDFWQVADDPTNLPTDTTTTVDEPLPDLRPYYLLLQLPGDTAERFQLVVPFVPAVGETQAGAVPNMVAWMAANSDPEGYGDVVALTLPAGRNVDSPALVFSRIRADTRFAADQTLLSQQGSRVIFGDLLVIPVGDAFLYVLPVYVRSTQGSAVPELKRVVVVNGVTVGLGNTFADALDSAVLGGEAPPPPPDGEPTPPDGPQDLEGLLAEALDHFAAAERALREGDLATYERELALAQDLVEQAQTLLTDQTAPTEPSPSP